MHALVRRGTAEPSPLPKADFDLRFIIHFRFSRQPGNNSHRPRPLSQSDIL
jgi:hypothetical protein